MIKGIYIHIPFCKKKCNYCAFCSFEQFKYKEQYVKSLLNEIKHFYKKEQVKTLYFGGGTPYLLNVNDFEKILSCFNLSNDTETTLELNPNDINQEKLKTLKSLGFNRLSIGVQSFCNETLKIIGRNHSKKDIYTAIEKIKNCNYKNISIDLMYGLPNQTIEAFEADLKKALALDIEHISLYGLKIEQGTYFYKNPPKNLPNLDLQAKMYENALTLLKEKFIHYEFSNFAKKQKFISSHNCLYWNNENYYGFGLSAAGYIDNKRYNNTCNLKKYFNNPLEKNYTILTKEQMIEEEVFLGLRLIKGLDFSKINKKFNINIEQYYKKEFDKFLSLNLLKKTKKGIQLTKKGVLVSNEVLCEFIKI